MKLLPCIPRIIYVPERETCHRKRKEIAKELKHRNAAAFNEESISIDPVRLLHFYIDSCKGMLQAQLPSRRKSHRSSSRRENQVCDFCNGRMNANLRRVRPIANHKCFIRSVR